MSALATGLALALVASLALNGSFLLQHLGAVAAPPVTPLRPIATVRGLLASSRWSAGLALGLSGWAMHVAALSRAPLSLVQAFVAGGLALTVPAARRWVGHRLAQLEGAAVVTMAAGLVVLSIGTHAGASTSGFSSGVLALFLAGVTVLAGALVVAPLGIGRAEALGAAAGLLYGAADVAIKALTGEAHHGGATAVLTSPWLPAAAVATAGAFFAFQRGLQSGRAVPVISLMTAATTAVSVLGGFVVFGDPLGHSPLLVVVHLLAFVLVGVAAATLAPVASAAEAVTPDGAPR
jgi:hypothetical protein